MRSLILPRLVLIAVGIPVVAAAQPPVVRIGVVIDGPWERNQEVESRFSQEILDLTRGEFDVRFPDEAHLVCDWSVERVDIALDALLASPDVDLVLTMGIIASDRVIRRGALPKPVIAPFVIDAEVQDAPRAVGGGSGVPNLNYLASSLTFARNVEVFRELRRFDKLAVLHGPLMNEIPGVEGRLSQIAREMGIELTLVQVRGRIEEFLDRLPPGVGAVYVNPLLELAPGELETLASRLIERRLPSLSVLGRSEVERGLLLSVGEDVFARRARRVALSVQRILLGEDPSGFPTDFLQREEIVINMATARAIDVYPSFALETVAELLYDSPPATDRRLSLELVAEEAVRANQDLQALSRELAASGQNIPIARSFLLPALDVNASGLLIDADRASATGIAERRFLPGLTLTQLLYSDSAWANKKIQEELQRSRELDWESSRLDVVLESTSRYLDVLRALTSERIQKENLALTRRNLELAQARVGIGASSPAEVYRWQAQLAADQSSLIRATSQRNQAEIAVNRLLHRPLEDPFATAEIGIDDPVFLYVRERFYPYISSRQYFDITRTALAAVAIEQAPEIQAIEAAIDARERSLLSSRRAFYLPDVFFQAGVEGIVKGGAGADGPLSGIGDAFPDLTIEQPNGTNWSVSASASFPLFDSGHRRAVSRQERELLSQLRFQREALRERVEARVRATLHQTGASYAGIALARSAADASRNNLELVQDAYARGVVSILDLLDAQNASVLSEEAAANAVYDFLKDMLQVERSLGRFYYRSAAEEIDALFERVDRYFVEQGLRPPTEAAGVEVR